MYRLKTLRELRWKNVLTENDETENDETENDEKHMLAEDLNQAGKLIRIMRLLSKKLRLLFSKKFSVDVQAGFKDQKKTNFSIASVNFLQLMEQFQGNSNLEIPSPTETLSNVDALR